MSSGRQARLLTHRNIKASESWIIEKLKSSCNTVSTVKKLIFFVEKSTRDKKLARDDVAMDESEWKEERKFL